MRVFIFEHITGGGMLDAPLPAGLAAQGSAMLTAAIIDFHYIGCEPITLLDMRAAGGDATSEAETFTLAPGDNVEAAFDQAAARADAALIIAPESDGLLADWAHRLDRLGVRSLGSSVDAIRLCGDKLTLYEHLIGRRIPAVMTTSNPRTLALPCVVKPRDGAGCESTHLVNDAATLRRFHSQENVIYQPWCAGQPASVSLLVHEGKGHVIATGQQRVTGESKLAYAGGRLPIEPAEAQRAEHLALRAVESVPGLSGFVGVDLMLGDSSDDDVVMEINPRLTVSFVALQPFCEPAIASMLLEPGSAPLFAPSSTIWFDKAGLLMREATT